MNKEQILSIIRHSLTAIGAVLVAKGYIDEVGLLTIIGAIMTATAGIWGVFNKSEGQVEKQVEAFRVKKAEIKKFTTNI